MGSLFVRPIVTRLRLISVVAAISSLAAWSSSAPTLLSFSSCSPSSSVRNGKVCLPDRSQTRAPVRGRARVWLGRQTFGPRGPKVCLPDRSRGSAGIGARVLAVATFLLRGPCSYRHCRTGPVTTASAFSFVVVDVVVIRGGGGGGRRLACVVGIVVGDGGGRCRSALVVVVVVVVGFVAL